MSLYEDILQLINDEERVSNNESVLEQHGTPVTYHEPKLPDLVVFPKSKNEVVKIVKYAAENDIPIVPFGVGSSLEGHIIPVNGGISLDFSLMNKIIDISPEDFQVTVEPGVTRDQLNKALKQYGLFFPIDPGIDATLGGMVATNASGTNAVRYGVMRDQVLSLEVVLADGTVITSGSSAVKSSAGYGLTSLFVGSEGTLGIFTEVKLRLYGIPEKEVAARAEFASIEEAGSAAVGLLSAGLGIGRVELVDESTIAAVNKLKQTDYGASPTLFLEFSGSEKEVDDYINQAKELLKEDCTSLQFESDLAERNKLWEARHHAGLAIAAANPGKQLLSTDVCVPISQLSDAITEARKTVEQQGIGASIFGHVGDGNYHVVLAVDPEDPESIKQVDDVNDKIVKDALKRGGTCTGEHGIGVGKMKYMYEEHKEALDVMRIIKKALDEKGILNPGKIFEMS